MNNDQDEKIKAAQAVVEKHQQDLLARPNVTSVGVGLRHRAGAYTDEVVIVVSVHTKHPVEALAAEEMLPKEIDGVPVDVQETGTITGH